MKKVSQITISFLFFVLISITLASASAENLSGTLTIWTFADFFKNYYEQSIPVILKEYPEVSELKLDVSVIGYNELYDKLNAAFISGEGIPDLVDVEIAQAGKFFKPDQPIYFSDLTEKFINSPFYDDIVLARTAPYTFNGKIYAIDCDMSATFLFYRKDIFDQFGLTPPVYWNEFVDYGLKLKDQEIFMTQVSSGQNPQVSEKHPLLQLMLQNDGKIFDENGNVALESPENEEALQFYADMVNKYGIATTSYAQVTDPTHFSEISKGKVATLYNPNWFLTFQLAGALPDQEGLWRAAHLPVFKEGGRRTSTSGGTSLMITKAAEDQGKLELAWRFYELNMLRKEGGLIHNSVIGWFPPIKSALSDPQVMGPVKFLGGQALGELFKEIEDEIPFVYNGPYWTDAWYDICSKLIYPILSEGKSPKDALSDMANHLRQLMEE